MRFLQWMQWSPPQSRLGMTTSRCGQPSRHKRLKGRRICRRESSERGRVEGGDPLKMQSVAPAGDLWLPAAPPFTVQP